MSRIYTLGWKPDPLDVRDFKFSVAKLEPVKSVYLAHKYKLPPVYDQSVLGSCTAQAIAFQVHFNLLNKNVSSTQPVYRPSRLFIYYYEREMIGTINVDSGAYLRDGIKVVVNQGAPSEDLWPYNLNVFTHRPPEKAIAYGLKTQATRYERVDNTNKELIVNALMQGFPVCFGMNVYTSFFTDAVENTGIVPMPDITKEPLVGGHAMTIVGYRLEDDSFIVRNSWGANWGQNGYCRIPASYLTSPYLAGDFWVIKMLE